MTGSIGESMVDMHSNPTGDHRVVQLKRAAANLIDMIEQMEVQPVPDVDGPALKKRATQSIKEGVDMAVAAACMRTPVETLPPEADQPGGTVEGAPV